MAYILCHNCGRVSVESMFCTFYHSSLLGANPKQEFKDGVYLGDVEGDNSPFSLPINPSLAIIGITLRRESYENS